MLGLWWIIYIVKLLNITLHVQESSVKCQGFIKTDNTVREKIKSQKEFLSPDIDPSAEVKIHDLLNPSY